MWAGIIAMIVTAIAMLGIVIAAPAGDDALNVEMVFAESETAQQIEAREWAEFNELARVEYEDLFTSLFEATEVKWSKNGRLMVKGANMKSFKFAAKGK